MLSTFYLVYLYQSLHFSLSKENCCIFNSSATDLMVILSNLNEMQKMQERVFYTVYYVVKENC